MDNLAFPVYILSKGVELPTEGIFFAVGRGGVYMHKDTGLVRALVKVPNLSFLEPLVPKAEINIPLIPQEIFVKSLSFFRWAQKKYHSEAAVLLHYSPAQDKFLLHCPVQEVCSAGVEYTADDRFKGYSLVCSIHSHNDFGAFHSGIDVNDEKHFDGLHLTIGNVGHDYFTVVSSIVVNDNRFPVDPSTVVDGLFEMDLNPVEDAPEIEDDEVDLGDRGLNLELDDEDPDPDDDGIHLFADGAIGSTIPASVGSQFSGLGAGYFGSKAHTPPKPKPSFDIFTGEESCQENWAFPRGWRKKVSRMKSVLSGLGKGTKRKSTKRKSTPKGGRGKARREKHAEINKSVGRGARSKNLGRGGSGKRRNLVQLGR